MSKQNILNLMHTNTNTMDSYTKDTALSKNDPLTKGQLEKAIDVAFNDYLNNGPAPNAALVRELLNDIPSLSMYLLNIFGFHDEILDNILDAKERDIFFVLQDVNLLGTEKEELLLPLSSRRWNVYHWYLRKDTILKLCSEKKSHEPKTSKDELFYKTLWAEQAASAKV